MKKVFMAIAVATMLLGVAACCGNNKKAAEGCECSECCGECACGECACEECACGECACEECAEAQAAETQAAE